MPADLTNEQVRGYTMLLHALGTIPVSGPRSRRRRRRICRELLMNYHQHNDPKHPPRWRNS